MLILLAYLDDISISFTLIASGYVGPVTTDT